ncbi:PspC domain-containing protein [Sphingomonas sp. SUN039]|uniref:PspC domain-containing protein n=1 Tax=Sphingomonas sp. SUN039 TaxID=2937787 RepID=UPI0021649F8A|nr:PspC domain-containing protein [Sphingomonas sp. SUN039]UVO54225.1 PspC domain-containing protein [Sphingomonas sp. SUN039]
MTDTLLALVRRDDTFFGVCQAVGDDFGFNPNWLRVALALPVIFNPWMSVVAYVVLALAVVASRLAAPVRATSVRASATVEPTDPVAVPAAANGVEELALAA